MEDAGKNWKNFRLQNAENFQTVDFFDEQTGWLADNHENIWNTTDNGKNWNQIYAFKSAKQREFLNVEEIKFTSANNGWLREIPERLSHERWREELGKNQSVD